MHRTRNAAYGQPYRGFESLPLRHFDGISICSKKIMSGTGGPGPKLTPKQSSYEPPGRTGIRRNSGRRVGRSISDRMEIDVSAFGHPDNPQIFSDALLEAYNLQSANRVWALIGPSGAGKSNLLHETAKIIQAQKIPCFYLPSDRRLSRSRVPLGGLSLPPFKDLDDLWSQIVLALSASHPERSRVMPNTDLSAILGFLFLQLVAADRSEGVCRYISELYEHDRGRLAVKPTKKPSLVKDVRRQSFKRSWIIRLQFATKSGQIILQRSASRGERKHLMLRGCRTAKSR